MKKFFRSRLGILLTIFTFIAMAQLSGHPELLAGSAFVFGTVDAVPGYADFEASGKIPRLFSRKSIVKFYDESVLPQISQRDYEGGR